MIVEFDAEVRRAAVEDEIDASVEIGEDMGRGRRADPAGPVGGRGRQRPVGGLDQRTCDRVARRAKRDGSKPGSRQRAHPAARGVRRDDRQRARPESFGQGMRVTVEIGLAHGRLAIEDMGDQRVDRRPIFGAIEGADRFARYRVGGEPIYRLRRHGDETAGAQNRRRSADPLGVGSDRFGPSLRSFIHAVSPSAACAAIGLHVNCRPVCGAAISA